MRAQEEEIQRHFSLVVFIVSCLIVCEIFKSPANESMGREKEERGGRGKKRPFDPFDGRREIFLPLLREEGELMMRGERKKKRRKPKSLRSPPPRPQSI